MKKTVSLFVLALVVLAVSEMYGQSGVAGKWTGEGRLLSPRSGQEITVKYVLELQTKGSTLTGTMNSNSPAQTVASDVLEGKIQGNTLSFVTVTLGTRVSWTAELKGSELALTRRVGPLSNGTVIVMRRAK